MSDNKKQVSRRQFLNYSLTGLGGFMAAGILLPNLRFAIDPVLQKKSTTENFVNVKKNVDDISEKPERIDWEVEQVDGWYKSDVKRTAWVLKMIMVIFKHFPQFVNTWDVSYLGRVIQITQISSFAHVTMVAIIKTVRMFHTHRHLHHLMCMNRKLKMVSYT